MADDIGSMALKVTAITDPLRAGLNQAIANIKAFESQANRSMGPPPGFRDLAAGVKDLHKDLGHVHAKAGLARTSLASLAVRGLAAGTGFGLGMMGVSGVVDAVHDFAFGSVQAAADAEKMSAAFEVMTGSADKAQAVLGKLRQYAKDSPLGTDTVLNTAKQLAAYGIEADQLAPTLRMLGDVAAGDAEKLKSVALAYGQVATTGRLMGDDLRQFNAAGIPLAEELAKGLGKPKEMIKLLVEEGKVGFPDVVKAFRSMTSEGGRFFGMSEKYAGTFAGSMENLSDAWQALKREFGGALVQELGLKDATKDLGAFTDRVRAGVNEIRPAIRFVGDLGRAAAQVGNELGKSAGTFLEIQFDALQKAFPGLGTFAQDAKSFVKSLGEVKFDPAQIVDAAADFAKLTVKGAEGVRSVLSDVWEKADQKFFQPFNRLIDRLDKGGKLLDLADKYSVGPGGPLGKIGEMQDNWGRVFGDSDADRKNIEDIKRRKAEEQAAIDRRYQGYTGGNPRERAGGALPVWDRYATGQSALGGVGAANAPLSPMGDFDRWVRNAYREIDSIADASKRGLAANAIRDMESKVKSAAANGYLPGAALVGGAFDAVGESARKAARELDKVEIPADPHSRAIQLGAKLGEQLRDPLDKFNEQLGDISFLASKGVLDDRTRPLAVAHLLDDLAKDLGQAQLPSAAEYGSKEAAKLQAEALAGRIGDDPAALLKALVDQGKEQLDRARRMEGRLIDDRLKGLSAATVFEW